MAQVLMPVGPRCGPDRRMRPTDKSDFQFFQSFSTGGNGSAMIETQAFIPEDYGNRSVVAIAMAGNKGYADTMISANEARELAELLILAANEADVLTGIRPA